MHFFYYYLDPSQFLGVISMPMALCNMWSTNSIDVVFFSFFFRREEKLKKHDVSGWLD